MPTAIRRHYGICEVCHTQTSHFRNNGAGTDQNHGNLGDLKGTNCTLKCHTHINGFIHGGGNSVCETCHNSGSHATHISSTSAIGPRILCHSCHDLNNMPSLKSGTDGDADGKYSLTETDVCDSCHSSGGAYDGVNNAIAGAKPNWASQIYSGSALGVGKEKWCVTCHDSGTSVISGRQAPDVAGDNVYYGYYVSGHGRTGAAQECSACHGLTMSHNFDGKKTYAGALDNYKQGFRLSDVEGMDPLNIPLEGSIRYNANSFKLCYSCHEEDKLLNDTKSQGCYGYTNNPYNYLNNNTTSITTGFRDIHPNGHATDPDTPANFHADHLIDVNQYFSDLTFGSDGFWYSDGPNTESGISASTCVTCHNPHGDKLDNGNASLKMTVGAFEITHAADSYGEYGQINGTSFYPPNGSQMRCSWACHGSPQKWYYNAVPTLDSIALTDNNDSDPASAENGFTNNQVINVTTNGYGDPTQMRCAENSSALSSTPWSAYAQPFAFTLTAGAGSKAVYCQTKNTFGETAIKNSSIVLDTQQPSTPTLTAPQAGQEWAKGTTNNITWSGISDTNLKTAPIALAYATDGGSFDKIADNETNDGTYIWLAPMIDSTTVQVSLIATDKAGNQVSVTSGNFTIRTFNPVIGSFSASDRDPANPSPAETSYTNEATVNIVISTSHYPTQMQLAEDAAFTQNPTGWIPYSATATYTLTAGDGPRTVWLQLDNDAAGESSTSSFAITLDATAPGASVPINSLLTSPNGGEVWLDGETGHQVTWNSGAISDTNLKTNPVFLEYSVNGGLSYPHFIATDQANDGAYAWDTVALPAGFQTVVRLNIRDKAGNQTSDSSDADFIINKPPDKYIVRNSNNSGTDSLREVISTLLTDGGYGTIWFNIPSNFLTNNVAVINLTSALPDLSAANITIDGGSQAVLSGITNPRGPAVRLHRSSTSAFNGFNITADSVTVQNLQLTNFSSYAINIAATGTFAVLEGNHIGFKSDSVTNYTNAGMVNYYGIYVNAPNCRIGGGTDENTRKFARNYLCGNEREAIYLNSAGGVNINGNWIGLRPDGMAMGNGMFYDAIYAGYPHNGIIQNNTFSGSSSGIFVADPNTLAIKGNIFGLYFDGTTWYSREQQDYAIRINDTSATNITIGGPNVANFDSDLKDSNVFSAKSSGSGAVGSAIYVNLHNGASPTKIYGNFIGTNPGRNQLFPGRIGVYLSGAGSYTVIGGGGGWEAGNVIDNMSAYGIYVTSGANQVKISKNLFQNNDTDGMVNDDAIFLAGTANNGITRPVITAADTSTVTVGGVASGDVVQVYLSDYDGSGSEFGEGMIFIGSVVASDSSTAVDVSGAGIGSGVWVTALRKDASNNTSAFSANVQVP